MATSCLIIGICVYAVFVANVSANVRENQDETTHDEHTTSTLRAVEFRLNQMEKKFEQRLQELEEENKHQAAEITYLKSLCSLRSDKPEEIAKKSAFSDFPNGYTNLSRQASTGCRDQLQDCLELQRRDYICSNPASAQNLCPLTCGLCTTHRTQMAFHTRVVHNLGNLTENQIIIFDKSHVNVGGGYENNTGIFRCSVPGTYVFAVTVVVRPHKKIELSFVKNGKFIGNVYASSVDAGFDSGSKIVIVELETGDSVWVKVTGVHTEPGYIIDGRFTTFSGFLL